MKRQRFREKLIRIAAVLSGLTATIKLWSATAEVKFMAAYDPVFDFLTNRRVILLVALVELGVAMLLISRRFVPEIKIAAICSLASSFLAYRLALWMTGYQGPCSCLGGATDWIPIPAKYLDWGLKGMLAYLLIAGYGFLIVDLCKPRTRVMTG